AHGYQLMLQHAELLRTLPDREPFTTHVEKYLGAEPIAAESQAMFEGLIEGSLRHHLRFATTDAERTSIQQFHDMLKQSAVGFYDPRLARSSLNVEKSPAVESLRSVAAHEETHRRWESLPADAKAELMEALKGIEGCDTPDEA